jgi:hypothetical protein
VADRDHGPESRGSVTDVDRGRTGSATDGRAATPVPPQRASRERYRAQLPVLVTDWLNGEGFFRPANPSDVKLPSPPEFKSALLQLLRRLLMERKLPKGCRIQPAKTTTC